MYNELMARSKYEKRAHKELEKLGWAVDYKTRPTRVPRNYNVDFLGLFDLIAYKPGILRFISIKGVPSGGAVTNRAEIAQMELPDGCTKEQWCKETRKNRKEFWRKYKL